MKHPFKVGDQVKIWGFRAEIHKLNIDGSFTVFWVNEKMLGILGPPDYKNVKHLSKLEKALE